MWLFENRTVPDLKTALPGPNAQELLERVKIMSARKRGPRKGVSRLVSAELAVAS